MKSRKNAKGLIENKVLAPPMTSQISHAQLKNGQYMTLGTGPSFREFIILEREQTLSLYLLMLLFPFNS